MAHLTPQFYETEYYIVDGTIFEDFDNACHYAGELLFANLSYDDDERYDDDEKITVTVKRKTGVIGRLSADGYLDCTEWTKYDSEADAKAELYDETRGYAVFTLPARFASALINYDWSSSELTSWDSLSIGKFIEDENIISFIDVIDDEPHFAKLNDLSQEGDSVIRYLARIDETATV